MNIFNMFRHKSADKTGSDHAEIEFGFRGENIIYKQESKEIEISFSWLNGARVYPDDIQKWMDGSPVTESEKEKIFVDVLRIIKKRHGKTIVVINADDPSRDLWERLCSVNQTIVKEIEYTSDEESFQSQRNMFLEMLQRGERYR
jgi:hypothetical protein